MANPFSQGFAQGFGQSFRPDLILSAVVQNREKRKKLEAYKDIIESGALDKENPTDILKAAIEKGGENPYALEAITELGDYIKNINKLKGTDNVYMFDPETGQTQLTGEVPRGSKVFKGFKRDIAAEKFDLAKEETAEIKKKKTQMVLDAAQDTLNTIKEIEDGIEYFGVLGAAPSIPGTERSNWEANVDRLLSKRIVILMNKMKGASKTGSTGFGQLSEKELKVLQDASTPLKRTLSPKDAKRYLNEMKKAAQKVLSKEKTGGITPQMAIEELKSRGVINAQ